MEKLGQLHRRQAGTRGRPRGTSSSSTRRRRARRSTSSTPRSGSARSSTAGSSGCSRRRPRPAAAPASRSSASGSALVTGDPVQGPRRPDARATSRRSSAPSTRCSAASAQRADADVRAAGPAVDGLPRRRRARAGRPARGVLLRRPARDASGCRWPASSLNRDPAGAGRPGSARRAPRAAAEDRPRRRRPIGLTAGPAGPARRPRGRADAAARAGATGSTVGHPGIPVVEVPALAADVHDLDGLREVGAALAGRPEPRPHGRRRHR